MRLLTLEGHVVVGKGENYQPSLPPLILPPAEPARAAPRSPRPGLTSSRSGFAHAIELLQQGTETLERSRRRWAPPRDV
jgi:hypothetical protein